MSDIGFNPDGLMMQLAPAWESLERWITREVMAHRAAGRYGWQTYPDGTRLRVPSLSEAWDSIAPWMAQVEIPRGPDPLAGTGLEDLPARMGKSAGERMRRLAQEALRGGTP